MATVDTMGMGVLTKEHLDQINKALSDIEEAYRQIDLAGSAHIDVSTLEKQVKDAEDKLRLIKSVYFPGQ